MLTTRDEPPLLEDGLRTGRDPLAPQLGTGQVHRLVRHHRHPALVGQSRPADGTHLEDRPSAHAGAVGPRPEPRCQVESVQLRSADLRADAVQEGERHGRLPRGQRGRGVEPACAPGQGTHGHQHQGEREEDRERAVRRRQHPPGRCEYRRRSQVDGCRQQQDRCHTSPGQAARSGVVARRLGSPLQVGQRASARGVERRRTSQRGACRHVRVRTHAAHCAPARHRGTGCDELAAPPVRSAGWHGSGQRRFLSRFSRGLTSMWIGVPTKPNSSRRRRSTNLT